MTMGPCLRIKGEMGSISLSGAKDASRMANLVRRTLNYE